MSRATDGVPKYAKLDGMVMQNMYEVFGVVDEEDAVQVVDLMFEYLRHETATAPLHTRTIRTSRTDSNSFVAGCGTIDATD